MATGASEIFFLNIFISSFREILGPPGSTGARVRVRGLLPFSQDQQQHQTTAGSPKHSNKEKKEQHLLTWPLDVIACIQKSDGAVTTINY